MKYVQDWLWAMAFIISGREDGSSDEQIIGLLEPDKEFLPTVLALLRDHQMNPKAFVAGYKKLEKKYQVSARKEKRARARSRKALVSAYRKLGRRAYLLSDTKGASRKRGARLQLGAAWMARTTGGMPSCRKGHLMDLAVYVTADEVREFAPKLKRAADVVFCACLRGECTAEPGTWKLVVKPPEVAKLVAAAGWTVKRLASTTDYPGHFEPGLAGLLRDHLPGVDEEEFEEELSEVIRANAEYGRSQIGGYGSFANPRWCEGCRQETCAPLITINRRRLGLLSKYQDGHAMLVVCRSCGRTDFNIECT